MMIKVIRDILDAATNKNARIVFAEGDDARVQSAARKLQSDHLCQPLLLSEARDFPDDLVRIQPSAYPELPAFADTLYQLRRHKGMTPEEAKKLAVHPLFFSALLARAKKADGAVGGAVFTTAEVISAGLKIIGLRTGVRSASSAFLMLVQDRVLTFADCAVIPEPNEQQLVSIALSAAELHRKLCQETPRVALLSFSTYGSAQHPAARKIGAAASLLQATAPDMCCAGEMQVDAALIPAVAAAKAADSPIQGDANVLIFPNLDSGNIGYKLVRCLAEATAIGPIVMGLNSPFMDVSRGCNSEDLVLIACIAAVLA